MDKKEAIEIVKNLIKWIEETYGGVAEFYDYGDDYNDIRKKFFESLEG